MAQIKISTVIASYFSDNYFKHIRNDIYSGIYCLNIFGDETIFTILSKLI